MNLERYNKCQNPINNYSVIHDMITAYSEGVDIENFLNTYSENRDITPINKSDEYNFLFNKYNNILTRVRNMSEEDVLKYSAKIENFAKLRNKMIKFGRVKSVEKWELLHKYDFYQILNQEFNWESNKPSENKFSLKGICTSDSLAFESRDESSLKHKIFISPINQDLYKLLDVIRMNFEKLNIPYYIKYQQIADKIDRNDKIIMFVDEDYFDKTLDVLDSIKEKNENICFRTCDTPVMTSRYDNWLGILDTTDSSMYSSRVNAINNGISRAINEYLDKYKGKSCRYQGKTNVFDMILKNEMISMILSQSNISNVDKFKLLKELKDVSIDTWYDIINYYSCFYISNSRECKTDNEVVVGVIPSSIGQINVTPNMLYDYYLKLARLFQEIDRDFDYLARIRIQDECSEFGIDPNNFAFNKENKQKII